MTGGNVVEEGDLKARMQIVARHRTPLRHKGPLVELVVVHVAQREEVEELLEGTLSWLPCCCYC